MSSKRKASPRPKAPKLVRGEPIVHAVLTATLEELARVGYGALRIEDVAARASVNKTTVYRRWPTKPELVGAALESMTGDQIEVPGTGTLRGDLLAILRRLVEIGCSIHGRGIFRMMVTEGPDSELMAIAKSLKERYEVVPRAVIEAAAARGEIAPGDDAMLLFEVLTGAVNRRLFLERGKVDDAFLERLVDLVLHGALAPAARREPARRPKAAVAPRRARSRR